MSSTLPPMQDCSTSPGDCECAPQQVSDKCYVVRERLPVCSDVGGSIPSSDCTKLDNTYDILLQSSVVPAVEQTTLLKVCNAAVYTAGQWIQFVDGSATGGIFQIVSINAVEHLLTIRNACADGISAIENNPSPGQTIETNSRFVVRGEPDCSSDEFVTDAVQRAVSLATELCYDNIATRSPSEQAGVFGFTKSSDCDESETRPCMRKLSTCEEKDGSLTLGNLDSADPNQLTPLYADANKTIRSGGAIASDNYVTSVCAGQLKIIKNGQIFVPLQQNIVSKATPDIDGVATWEEDVDFTTILANAGIVLCEGNLGHASIRGNFRVNMPDSGEDVILTVGGVTLCRVYAGESTGSNRQGDAGSIIVPIPSNRILKVKIESEGTSWAEMVTLTVDIQGIFV